MEELSFLGHVNLRGNSRAEGFSNATQRCLGLSLPLEANTVTENGAVTALWLGPDEWLLLTLPGKEGELIRTLREALHDVFIAVTDVTDGQTILRVSGPHAADVLRKGCSLDLHPDVFGHGSCAQTHLDKIGVVIRRVDQTPAFDLIVRRSFSEYLALWLEDAAAEYGFALIPTETAQ